MDEKNLFLPFSIRMPARYGDFEVTYFEFCKNAEPMPQHTHVYYELCYVLQGALQIDIEGTRMSLQASQCVIIAMEVKHQYISDENVEYFIMRFDSTLKNPVKKDYQENAFFVRLNEAVSNTYQKNIIIDQYHCYLLISELEKEFQDKKWAYKIIMGNICSSLLFLVLRNLDGQLFNNEDMQQYPERLNMPVMIEKYIYQHFKEDITLKAVAEAMHLSERQVQRLLVEYQGKRFNDIVNNYRYNEAKKLLQDISLSLEKVANLVGFQSSRSLYNLFEKYGQYSLSEYRKMCRAKEQ